MIEKMARAMAVANNDYDGDYLCWSAYENYARAALEALLELSMAMMDAGDDTEVDGVSLLSPEESRHAWQAMIQAALEEKE